MKLTQKDIDFVERQAKMLVGTEMLPRIQVFETDMVMVVEHYMTIAGNDRVVDFLRRLVEMCELYAEHGDALHDAFNSFIELYESYNGEDNEG